MTMISFDGLVCTPELKRVLERMAQSPANGYLFLGAQGVGKRFIAKYLGARLLQLESIDQLPSHPDVLVLKRDASSKEIKVKQARELIARLALSSARGGHQIVFIEDIDRLNEESANSLLKLLEEPPKGVVFLATSDRGERVLPTIRSRLIPVHCQTLRYQRIQQELIKRGVSSDDAGIIALRSHGAIGDALSQVERVREVVYEHEEAVRVMRILVEGNSGRIVSELERLAKRCNAADDSEEAWITALRQLQDAATTVLTSKSDQERRVAQSLAWAWRLIGTSLSPHLALEWGALSQYRSSQEALPSFIASHFV